MRALTLSVLLVLSPAVAGAGAAADGFRPHRAVYDLSVGDVVPGSAIAALEGRMIYEWASACDGTTVMERAEFDAYDSDGNGQTTAVSFSSFESADGRVYRFATRSVQGDAVEEIIRGRADMADDGSGGRLVFHDIEGGERRLAPETLFPHAHLRRLLQLAREGGGVFEVPVVLGQREDEPLLLTTVVGASDDGDGSNDADGSDVDLIGRPPLDVSMAYFLPEVRDGLPLFEVHQKVHETGVVARADVVYPEFSLVYQLRSVQALPVPECD